MRCCFCGHERGGVYTKRLDSVAGPLDCCSHCDASFRERDRIASFERAVLAACVEERRAFELRQALPSQIEAVTRYDDAIRARRAAVTQYVAALDAEKNVKQEEP